LLVRQGSPSFQVVLDLKRVLAKGPLDLLVKVLIPVVDRVDVLVFVELAPPAEGFPLLFALLELFDHFVDVFFLDL